MSKRIDSRDYDISLRADGKRNVWTRKEILPQQWEWVIVHVGQTFAECLAFVRQQPKAAA